MRSRPRHVVLAVAIAACVAGFAANVRTADSLPQPRAAAPSSPCDPDNGGLTLPDGFCAKVVADGLGATRHLAVRENGDVYVQLESGGKGGSTVALRDADGDGRLEQQAWFGDHHGTGLELRTGYVYVSSDEAVYRYQLTPGQLKPTGARETVVSGFAKQQQHSSKPIAFDGQGNMYVTVGAPSNACQAQDRKAGVPGQKPCPLLERHGGIWRFKADELGQTQEKDGHRYVTGLRNAVAIGWDPASDSLYLAQHGRDQLNTLWPGKFTDEQNAELPAEEFHRVSDGSDIGWPYCYYDQIQNLRLLNPEYGGDGKTTGSCSQTPKPLVAFPGHWGPNDLLFYTATAFPEKYRGGAFIAFHGSWNRAPLPQGGYLIAFVPMKDGAVTGPYETFANGFAGRTPLLRPGDAAHRPTGLAVGPDGSLYISDDVKGRIWRVSFKGVGSVASGN